MSLNRLIPKRETCRDYMEGYCRFYGDECFHDDEDPLGSYRCNRLIPRTEEEMMPWMGELCSDCNEVVCNDCNMYIEYSQRVR